MNYANVFSCMRTDGTSFHRKEGREKGEETISVHQLREVGVREVDK